MKVEDSRAIQPFLGMAASLAYILAIDWNPLISPERKRLPGPSKSDPIKINTISDTSKLTEKSQTNNWFSSFTQPNVHSKTLIHGVMCNILWHANSSFYLFIFFGKIDTLESFLIIS